MKHYCLSSNRGQCKILVLLLFFKSQYFTLKGSCHFFRNSWFSLFIVIRKVINPKNSFNLGKSLNWPKFRSASLASKEISSSSSKTGLTCSKTEVSHYFDTEKIPETFSPAISNTAYVTILNNSFSKQVVVYVPENPDVMKVCFKFNNSETWHYLHTGTINTTPKGVKFVNISSLDYWNPEDNVSGNQLVIPE